MSCARSLASILVVSAAAGLAGCDTGSSDVKLAPAGPAPAAPAPTAETKKVAPPAGGGSPSVLPSGPTGGAPAK